MTGELDGDDADGVVDVVGAVAAGENDDAVADEAVVVEFVGDGGGAAAVDVGGEILDIADRTYRCQQQPL